MSLEKITVYKVMTGLLLEVKVNRKMVALTKTSCQAVIVMTTDRLFYHNTIVFSDIIRLVITTSQLFFRFLEFDGVTSYFILNSIICH